MQRRTFTLTLATAFSAPALLWPRLGLAAQIGQPAPSFSLEDVTGRIVNLADFRGRPVVLEWFKPSCPFIRKHYQGHMQALQREFTARGVAWLVIQSTDMASPAYMAPYPLAQWMRDHHAAPTAVLMDEDGTVGRAFSARVTPHMFIIHPNGTLVYSGAIDSVASTRASDIPQATNFVRQGLNELLAGQALSIPLTRPYGCPIHFKPQPA